MIFCFARTLTKLFLLLLDGLIIVEQVFDFEHDKRLIGSLLGLSSGAISLAFGDEGSRLAVGLANGLIHLVDIIPVPRTSNNCSASITETITSSLQQGGKTIMF